MLLLFEVTKRYNIYTLSGIPYVRCCAWARCVKLRAIRYRLAAGMPSVFMNERQANKNKIQKNKPECLTKILQNGNISSLLLKVSLWLQLHLPR